MKNKFEALTTFQSWPEDWQRLCAEFWAENDRGENVAVWATSDKLATAAKLMQAEPQSVAKTVEECVPAGEFFAFGKYTPRQEEHLVKCCHENRHKNGKVNRKKAALQFLAKYPGRSEESVREKARVLENRNWKINY
jgi:hypothetical protein